MHVRINGKLHQVSTVKVRVGGAPQPLGYVAAEEHDRLQQLRDYEHQRSKRAARRALRKHRGKPI